MENNLSEENKIPQENPEQPPKRKRKGFPWFIRVLFLGLVGVIAIQLVFRFYADEIIGTVMKEVVAIKSKGLYSLSYDDIYLDVLTSKLKMENFKLTPNREAFFNDTTQTWQTKNNVFEVDIPSVKLEGASLLDFYINRSQRIKLFEVENPKIKAYLQEKDSVERENRLKLNNIHFIIADKIDFLLIENLRIKNADVELHVEKRSVSEIYNLNNVSISAINFMVDSLQNREDSRPFTVEDITVQSGYNFIKLPNSPYSLSLESLSLSTYAEIFEIEGLNINCDETTKVGRGKFGRRNAFEIYTPKLNATGVNFRGAYFDKILTVNNLRISEPEIVLFTRGEKKNPAENAKRLYSKISKQLKELLVRNIELEDAYLQVNRNTQEQFFLDHITGTLTNFLLDSTNHEKRSEFFYVDDAELEMENYQANWPNPFHRFSTKNVTVSTRRNLFEAKQVSVNCKLSHEQMIQTDSLGKVQSYNLSLPLVKFTDFDIRKAYVEKAIDIGYALLYKPKVDYFVHVSDSMEVEKSDSLVRIKDVYPYIKKALASVEVDKFELKEASLGMIQQFGNRKGAISIDTASVRLFNVKIDAQSKLKENIFLNTRQIEIDLDSIYFIRPDSLYELSLSKLRASQQDSLILLQNFSMKPLLEEVDFLEQTDLPSNFFNIQFKEVRLDSVDVTKAYYSRLVEIDQLTIDEPKVSLFKNPISQLEEFDLKPTKSISGFLSKNFKTLDLSKIVVKNGFFGIADDERFASFRLSTDSIEGFANDLLIDSATLSIPNMLFVLDTFNLKSQNFAYYLEDETHVLRAKKLGVSTNEEILFAQNITLSKHNEGIVISRSNEAAYEVELPEIRLVGFDPKLFYYDKVLEAEKLTFPNIRADLRIIKEEQPDEPEAYQPKVSLVNLYNQLIQPSKIKSINIGEIVSDGNKASIKVYNEYGGFEGAYSGEDIYVKIPKFSIDSTSKFSAKRMFYADNLLLGAQNYYQFLPDSSYSIHLEKTDFDAQKGNFVADEININPYKKVKGEDFVNVYIPHFQLDNIDLHRFYQTKQLAVKKLQVSAPWFRLSQFPKAEKSEFAMDSLPVLLQPYLADLEVETLSLEQGKFHLHQFDSLQTKKYYLGKLDVLLNGLHVSESVNQNKKELLFSDKATISLKDYKLNLPDSLNSIYVKEMRLESDKNRILFDTLHYEPLYPRYEYAQKVGLSTDRIGMRWQSAVLSDLDVRRLLAGKGLHASKFLISYPRLSVFKDNTNGLPHKEDRLPKLPRELIKSFKSHLHLDTLQTKNGRISYSEHAKFADTTGTLTLNKLNLKVLNIYNDTSLLNNNDISLEIKLQTKVMNAGRLDAYFNMPYNTKNGEFYLEGIMDTMALSRMNPMIEPIAFLKIRNGDARKIVFKVDGNNDYATGIMRFYYKKLNISVLNKEKHTNKGLISFIANTFVLNSSNPKYIFFLKRGKMYFKRDPSKSFVNYWVNILMSGLKTSIGLKNKEKPPKGLRKNAFDLILDKFKVENRNRRKMRVDKRKQLRKELKKRKREEREREEPNDVNDKAIKEEE